MHVWWLPTTTPAHIHTRARSFRFSAHQFDFMCVNFLVHCCCCCFIFNLFLIDFVAFLIRFGAFLLLFLPLLRFRGMQRKSVAHAASFVKIKKYSHQNNNKIKTRAKKASSKECYARIAASEPVHNSPYTVNYLCAKWNEQRVSKWYKSASNQRQQCNKCLFSLLDNNWMIYLWYLRTINATSFAWFHLTKWPVRKRFIPKLRRINIH